MDNNDIAGGTHYMQFWIFGALPNANKDNLSMGTILHLWATLLPSSPD